MPDCYQTIMRVLVVFLLVMIATPSAMAQTPDGAAAWPPAGQMCPQGAYVIGFDGGGNIVCSQVCGNDRLDAGEACDDGNTVGGDGCSAACQPEVAAAPAPPVAPVAREATPSAVAAPAAAAAAPPAPTSAPAVASATARQLAITDVEPSSVLYGAREVTLTIHGAGFHRGTVVLFNGSTYTPSVNPAGSELKVTLPTSRLAMGRYPVKVSNGPDEIVKWGKPLVVF